jgi:hypothetical protein
MAQKCIFGFRPKYFYHRNNTAETEICDDANKKRGQHTLVWLSTNMSAVWTFFNVSKKDPHIVICKNCNALILMKLVHSHSHKCNGTRVALPIINGINSETRSTAIISVHSPLTLGDSAPILGDSVL